MTAARYHEEDMHIRFKIKLHRVTQENITESHERSAGQRENNLNQIIRYSVLVYPVRPSCDAPAVFISTLSF